jgi:hypothetical protein
MDLCGESRVLLQGCGQLDLDRVDPLVLGADAPEGRLQVPLERLEEAPTKKPM